MTNQWKFRLTSAAVRDRACHAIDAAPDGAEVLIRERTRTLDQNARMWAMLRDVAQAKPEGREHTPEVWKALFMHALGHEVAFAHGLNGEPFPLGFRSSKLNTRQMGDLMEFMSAWGSERGVVWSEPNPYERA